MRHGACSDQSARQGTRIWFPQIAEANGFKTAGQRFGAALRPLRILFLLFGFEKSANSEAFSWRVQRVHEFLKALGEKIPPQFPVAAHPRRNDVMPKQLAPAFAQLEIQQAVSVVSMNGLEGFQKLIAR